MAFSILHSKAEMFEVTNQNDEKAPIWFGYPGFILFSSPVLINLVPIASEWVVVQQPHSHHFHFITVERWIIILLNRQMDLKLSIFLK